MQQKYKSLLIWVFLIVMVVAAYQAWDSGREPRRDALNWSQFMARVEAGDVREVTVKELDYEGTLKDNTLFRTTGPIDASATIAEKLREKGVTLSFQKPEQASLWVTVLLQYFPLVLLFLLFFFFMRQLQSGGGKAMSFGKSRAKLMTEHHNKITFADVAGIDESKDELEEIIAFLKEPKKFTRLGGRIPKGVLLMGPPGTGKTLLARAVAGEAGVPFFSISGSDFVEMFVGVGASRVRDLFEQAKASAPAIIFMDEIDAVGRHRGAGLGGGHDEREQTLNQLLVEMDGFDMKTGVILIAATNRPDILDPALLRPGRFDRQIVVDRPDLNGRTDILKVHTREKPLADDVDLEVLARRTPGFTGADLANLVNEAALLSARHSKKKLDMEEMEEAIDRVIAGPERRTRLISEKEKEIIAYHETGHALVAHELPNADPVHKISIIPRGQALGYTLTLPTEDKYLVTKSELVDELAMLLGGRVAEELIFSELTTGDQNDIEKATKLARKMVCEFGMSEKLGPLTLGQKQGEVFLGRDLYTHQDYSDRIAYEIDQEVRRLVDEAYERARGILESSREKLDTIARTLIERETLEKNELLALLEGKKAEAASEPRMAAKGKQSPEKQQEEVRAPTRIKGRPLPQPE